MEGKEGRRMVQFEEPEEEENNNLDITIVEDEEELEECERILNGEDDNQEYNFAAATALRKDLSATFEKHAHQASESTSDNNTSGGSVLSKVARFEKGFLSQNKNASTTMMRMRPPVHPAPAVLPQKSNNSSNSLLKVFLRIRPPFSSLTDDASDETTMEVLAPPGGSSEMLPTTVRTYPPTNSNTAKANRGVHDYGSSTEDGVCVKGVKGVKEFDFNAVFGPEQSQAQLYAGVASDLIGGLFPNEKETQKQKLVGQSALLFAYGITNAGKTHTIMGECNPKNTSNNSHDDPSFPPSPKWGIIPRSLHQIFGQISGMEQSMNSNPEFRYEVRLSYFEIYNETLYDLLPKESKKASKYPSAHHHRRQHPPKQLKLREGRGGNIFVRGLAQHRVENVSHGLELVEQAKQKRHTSSNNINTNSSRSHCICQLQVVALTNRSFVANDDDEADHECDSASGYNTDDEEQSLLNNKNQTASMWIVDLAGSERSKRTGTVNRSARQKEAALINSSLMKLMRCLQLMLKKQQDTNESSSIIPFRESKLTHLFMNHLMGPSASRTCMVVNANPAAVDFDETQHVLSYGTVTRSIQISEVDYNRKRRALVMSNGIHANAHTHGDDGRLIHADTAAGKPPKKIAKLAKKLSPRAALARRREQQVEARKRKADLQSMRGATSRGSENSNAGPNTKSTHATSKSMKVELSLKHEDEIKALQTSIIGLKEGATALRSENLSLREALSQRETEIRMEVADEMEAQMKAMREEYTNIVNRYKNQINTNPTPARSARKAQMDKAEQYIEELMDKNDECEEEMVRMREVHETEISNIRKLHDEALAAKGMEIASLKQLHEEAMLAEQDKEKQYKQEIDQYCCQFDELTKNRNDILAAYEDLEARRTSYDNEEDDYTENQPPPEAQVDRHTPNLVRRLPRGRISEVACSNSIPDMASSSLKKKKGMRFLRSKIATSETGSDHKRKPLKNIDNVEDNDWDESELESDNDEDEAYLYPAKPVEKSSSSGLYFRPRGRAPSGREWDEEVGAWRLAEFA